MVKAINDGKRRQYNKDVALFIVYNNNNLSYYEGEGEEMGRRLSYTIGDVQKASYTHSLN